MKVDEQTRRSGSTGSKRSEGPDLCLFDFPFGASAPLHLTFISLLDIHLVPLNHHQPYTRLNMVSTKFGTEALEPIPPSGPGIVPLRRRTSAPELADLNAICSNSEELYKVGNIIRIQIPSSATTRNKRTVTARIIETFAPFSMASVVVVRVFEPTMDLRGDFVLKVYDNRCTDAIRQQYRVDRWSRVRDMELEKRRWSKHFVNFFHKIMADWFLYAGEDEDEMSRDSDMDEDDRKDEEDASDELFFQAVCLKMYRAELEVYRQARECGIDGIDVPRFISSVRIPPSYHSKNCRAQSANIKGIPGILIQYLPGFSLSALYKNECPPLPRSHWQYVIDDGVRIIHYMTTKMAFHNADSCPRNTVVHWDPTTQRWKCKIIDFGHCEIRQEGTSDRDWRERQALQDEEGSIGRFLESALKAEKDFDYEYKRSQYSLDLAYDFIRDDPGITEGF